MPDLDALARSYRSRPPAGLVLTRVHEGATEVASAGPVEARTVFELGSITKVATGLLLADAVVRGDVALDTTADACLDGAPALRLADLAAHTSGLPRLPKQLLRRAGRFDLTDPYAGTTVPELLDDLAGTRIGRSRRRYSNVGAALLGQALAAVVGAPYERIVEERVLRPLGVEEIWADAAPDVATPHTRRGRPVRAWRMGAYAPAGCLRGTAGGALALARACIDPPPAMAEAVALALTPRGPERPLGSGLGWLRAPVARGTLMWWHNGGTHGSRSFVGFVPEHGTAVAAVANSARSVDGVARRALTAD